MEKNEIEADMKSSPRRKWLKLIFGAVVLVALLFGLSALRDVLQKASDEEAQKSDSYASPVNDRHPILKEFRESHPDLVVILAFAEDITDDGKEDLILFFEDTDGMSMLAYVDQGDGSYTELPAIPAPREEQKIKFFDMDHTGPIEILVTGSKNGQVGYAVYRVMDGKLVNLFGEGMEECC